eukprot:724545-Prymnesium_polylepis.5
MAPSRRTLAIAAVEARAPRFEGAVPLEGGQVDTEARDEEPEELIEPLTHAHEVERRQQLRVRRQQRLCHDGHVRERVAVVCRVARGHAHLEGERAVEPHAHLEGERAVEPRALRVGVGSEPLREVARERRGVPHHTVRVREGGPHPKTAVEPKEAVCGEHHRGWLSQDSDHLESARTGPVHVPQPTQPGEELVAEGVRLWVEGMQLGASVPGVVAEDGMQDGPEHVVGEVVADHRRGQVGGVGPALARVRFDAAGRTAGGATGDAAVLAAACDRPEDFV